MVEFECTMMVPMTHSAGPLAISAALSSRSAEARLFGREYAEDISAMRLTVEFNEDHLMLFDIFRVYSDHLVRQEVQRLRCGVLPRFSPQSPQGEMCTLSGKLDTRETRRDAVG